MAMSVMGWKVTIFNEFGQLSAAMGEGDRAMDDGWLIATRLRRNLLQKHSKGG
jgi:hypothetical protein